GAPFGRVAHPFAWFFLSPKRPWSIGCNRNLFAWELQLNVHQFKVHRLSAFPQRLPPQSRQLFLTRHNGHKVIAGKLPGLAGETDSTVGQQYLGLAHASRIEQNLSRRGVACCVLASNAEISISQRDP